MIALAIPSPIDVVTAPIQDAGESVVRRAFDGVFDMVAAAVRTVTDALIEAITASATVDLAGGWWQSPEQRRIAGIVLAMSASLLAVFFLLTLIRSLVAGEPAAMIRAALIDLPVAVFGSAAVATVAGLLLAIVDGASAAVLGDVGANLGQFHATLGVADALGQAGLLGLVFAVLYLSGALLLWLELVMRSALIYLVIVFAPLAFSARVFPAARRTSRRLVEIGLALIISKFAIAVALAVGSAALAASTPDQATAVAEQRVDLRGMLVGVAIMLTAAFMPWMLLKVIPVFEDVSAAQDAGRAPLRGAAVVMSSAIAATSLARMPGSSSTGGQSPGGSGAASPVAPLATATATGSPPNPAPAGSISPGAGGGGQPGAIRAIRLGGDPHARPTGGGQ